MEERYLAFLMTVLFVLVVVVGRVLWQLKTVGDSGIRSGTLAIGKTKLAISLVLFGHFPVQGLLALGYALSYFNPQIQLGLTGSVIGVVLCVFGIALASYSQFSMKEHWRIGVNPLEKTQLVTTGIYASVRNPIYTACIIYGLGIVILVPHVATLFSGITGLLAILFYVRKIEEPHLLNLHGESYRQYMAVTKAYLPRF